MKPTAVLFGLVFLPLTAAANESFLLTVPVREDTQRQTGEVRITLGLDAPPAGSQLVINETATVTLGQTITVGGEPITYEAAAGNSARILYKPLQNFPAPGNFCTSLGIQRELQIRFVGTQDIVDYRISSYSVGAPEFECSKPFRRVGDFPAFITPFADATTPELVALNKARHELDVVLVLDKSGSMSNLPPGSDSGPSKAELLRDAVQTFIAQWRELDAAKPDALGVEFEEDRIGLVFFDATAVPQNVTNAFFVERGPDGVSPHQWDAVITHVDTLAPGNTTTVGGGINEAMEQWLIDPDNDLSVILVTDGIQNTAPLVETTAPDSIVTLQPVGSFVAELRKRSVPIYTIGFGLPSGVDQALLQNISTQTTGQTFIAVDALTLFDTFGQTLVNFLKGNTIAALVRRSGTLPLGTDAAAPETFAVDASVDRVLVTVQFTPAMRGLLDVEVTGPGGVPLTPASFSSTDSATMYRFDLGANQTGDWTVRVKRGPADRPQDASYHLSVLAVEKKLEYAVSLDKPQPATGDRIAIRTRIAFDGKALNKLPAGAVRVRVQRPPEALGTILHASNARVTGQSVAGDTQSPYEGKLAALTSPAFLQRIYPRDVETITLQEERPGLYTGTFGGTTVPGMYVFEATLDWNDPRTGRVHREERLEAHVKVRPDPVATIVTRAGDTVSVTPRDRFGNYLGPGYASKIDVTGATGEAVDADQTGTYAFTLTGDPDVAINVDGVDIPTTTASASKWRGFLDVGGNFLHGGFSRSANGELSVNAGVERVLTPHWSFEAILGYHGHSHIFENQIAQGSLGGKYWFGSSRLRPFLGASIGGYYLPDDETRFGANAGAGALYQFTPRLGIEGVYTFHVINNQRTSLTFSTVQAGMRLAF